MQSCLRHWRPYVALDSQKLQGAYQQGRRFSDLFRIHADQVDNPIQGQSCCMRQTLSNFHFTLATLVAK